MNPITAIRSLLLPKPPHRAKGVCYTYAHFARVPKAIDVFLDRDDGTWEYVGEYVPKRTCKNLSKYCNYLHCSECGCGYDFLTDDPPNFCPKCGARIEEK